MGKFTINFLQFCPNCGSKKKELPQTYIRGFHNSRLHSNYNKKLLESNRYDCDNCGFFYYINPAPTVGAIISNDKKGILLTKRAFEPKKGMWDLPGGFMEIGETPQQTIFREIREELSVEIEPHELVGFFPDSYGQFNWPTLNIYYHVTIKSGKIKVGDDVVEAKWFNLNKLPEFAFTNGKNAVDTYMSLHGISSVDFS